MKLEVVAAQDPEKPRCNLLQAGILPSSPSGDWIDLDVVRLKEAATIVSRLQEKLPWIEAFKLWLPEYSEELRQRNLACTMLPLHLSFAEMAGIDLHSMPPPGSYLAELLVLKTDMRGASPYPYPSHNDTYIRHKIRVFFQQEPAWSREMLAKHCSQEVLKDLGLHNKRSWPSQVKRLARKIFGVINPLGNISN